MISNTDSDMNMKNAWLSAKNTSMVAFNGVYVKKRKKRGAYIEKDIFKKRGRAETLAKIFPKKEHAKIPNTVIFDEKIHLHSIE